MCGDRVGPEQDGTDFEVDPIQEVLHRLRLGGLPFLLLLVASFRLLLFLVEHVRVDEFRRAHLVVQQASGAHGGFC